MMLYDHFKSNQKSCPESLMLTLNSSDMVSYLARPHGTHFHRSFLRKRNQTCLWKDFKDSSERSTRKLRGLQEVFPRIMESELITSKARLKESEVTVNNGSAY